MSEVGAGNDTPGTMCSKLATATKAKSVTANFSFASTPPVVEFHNSILDHYFITADPLEATAVDNGSAGPGWSRTGLTFKAYAVAQTGYSPICRFYLPPPADSHFYSASPQECAAVAASNPSFILESTSVMQLAQPNPISGRPSSARR